MHFYKYCFPTVYRSLSSACNTKLCHQIPKKEKNYLEKGAKKPTNVSFAFKHMYIHACKNSHFWIFSPSIHEIF